MSTRARLLALLTVLACINSYQLYHLTRNPHPVARSSQFFRRNGKVFELKSSTATFTDEPAQSLPQSSINTISSLNRLFYRSSVACWWIQIILCVISGTILTFANTVRHQASHSFWLSGFSLSAIGVCISFVNAFWTWNFTRLNRRIRTKKISVEKIIPTMRKYSRISVGLSLAGMLVTLLGAEQIVGNLASKVLSSQALFGVTTYAGGQSSALQPLDIFLVQANTNALVSHFAPLLCYNLLQTQLHPLHHGNQSDISASPLQRMADE